MSTNAENLVKIVPIAAQIFGALSDFCRLIYKDAVVILIISGVSGWIFIKFAQDVATILPLYILKSEWQYCNPFWNTAVPIKDISNFAIKLFAMATSFEKEVQIDHLRRNTITCWKIIVKIGPLDPEIIDLHEIVKKIKDGQKLTQTEHLARRASFTSGLEKAEGRP